VFTTDADHLTPAQHHAMLALQVPGLGGDRLPPDRRALRGSGRRPCPWDTDRGASAPPADDAPSGVWQANAVLSGEKRLSF
jgi:hypothetical protein